MRYHRHLLRQLRMRSGGGGVGHRGVLGDWPAALVVCGGSLNGVNLVAVDEDVA
jgi:hypothetical protein